MGKNSRNRGMGNSGGICLDNSKSNKDAPYIFIELGKLDHYSPVKGFIK